jgi:hypothetical protein
MARRKLRSIVDDVPVKVEMNVVNPITDKVLSTEELQIQIEEARKGRAKVDSKYVGNADGLNHLFDYSYDYAGFLADMSYIIKKGKGLA